MLNLLKICTLSLVVSFGVFANSDEAAEVNIDSQELVLDQNSDQYLGFVKDAFSKIKNFVVGKVLGGCKDVKAQIDSEEQIPDEKECDADPDTKKTCLSNIKLMKSCF